MSTYNYIYIYIYIYIYMYIYIIMCSYIQMFHGDVGFLKTG